MPHSPFTFTRRRAVAAVVVLLVGGAVWFFFLRADGLTRQRVWSAQSSSEVGPLLYSPDGKTLISGGADPVRLWDPATGALTGTLSTYEASAGRFAISPAGNILGCTRFRRARGQPDQHTVEFWDLATARRITSIDAPVVRIAFSPTNAVVATSTQGPGAAVTLWSLPTITRLATLPPIANGAGGLAFSPDGKFLAVGEVAAVELFDVKTLAAVRTFAAPTSGHCGALAFSADGRTLAAVIGITAPSTSGALWTWDAATARAKVQLDFGHGVHDCSFSADGSTVAVHLLWYVFGRRERIDVYDVERGRRTCSLSRQRPWMWSVALSPDASQLAVGFQPQTYTVPATIGTWRVE